MKSPEFESALQKEQNPDLLTDLKTRFNTPLVDKEMDRDGEHITFSFTDELAREITGHSFFSYEAKAKNESEERLDWADRYDEKTIKEEVRDFFKSSIEGEAVLDLGSGVFANGYLIADALNAKEYVGVEMNYPEIASKRCGLLNGETPFLIVQADLMDVLAEMIKTNQKVKTIIFSGIDNYSNTGGSSISSMWERLVKVLDDEGILIIGGNIDQFGVTGDEDYGDTEGLKKLFEKVKIELPMYMKVYKKKLDSAKE